ncbi:hypothetical protein V8E36_007807 [Tilletia maclaganii]
MESGLDAGIDEELGRDRLDHGLTRLEVVVADECLVALGELDAAGHKGVLGRAVDVRCVLEDAGHSEDGRGGDVGVGLLDGLEKVVSRVVDARNDVGAALRVSGPDDDDWDEVLVVLGDVVLSRLAMTVPSVRLVR